MSPNSCAVLLPSKQPLSCSVTDILATVMRLRDSTDVWNFPFIFTDSVELKGYAFIIVFFKFMSPSVLKVFSSMILMVEPVSNSL